MSQTNFTANDNLPKALPEGDSSLRQRIGFSRDRDHDDAEQRRLLEYVHLKLAVRGYLPVEDAAERFPFIGMARSMLANIQEKNRILSDYLCPADQAIHDFLSNYLGDVDGVFAKDDSLVPTSPLVLERHGIARILSLPANSDRFESPILSSHRVHQGVLHNPLSDKRTTKGVFHIAEGGLPIPHDKEAVPKEVFARLLWHALRPPDELSLLPFTSHLPPEDRAHVFVSLLLRPVVCPAVPGVQEERSMEVRFFAPGTLTSNLDFVESIFGNAGDPYLPDNDARLETTRWSGHTGCVILAPHLTKLTKKQLGLPHVSIATDRQKRDRMCWTDESELYNDGTAFKVTCRDKRGVMVTLIADSYFGYCKKEVKTQISFASNLLGNAEEEHAGGALAFPSVDLGEDFQLPAFNSQVDHTWQGVVRRYADLMTLQPEGYGIDKLYPDIIYLPEDAHIELHNQTITWRSGEHEQRLKLLPDRTYMLPSGYKLEMQKPSAGQRWRLVGTNAEGTFCHKPCTVSGGGKSEISKALADAMIGGPVLVFNFEKDLELAAEIIARDYGGRFRNPTEPKLPSRPLLDPSRSFGSVVRMLTPADNYTDEYNAWLATIPRWVRDFVCIVKRLHKPEWGEDWRSRFSVNSINGKPGNELRYRNQTLSTRYLRVGFTPDGSWRTFGLRQDFAPAFKLQREDDISAAVVVPADRLDGLHPELKQDAYKFAINCEYRLFQRPDDAIHRGYDKVTERDFARPGNFFSNYQPLPSGEAAGMLEDAIRFEQFTEPMRELIAEVADHPKADYFVSSAHPRLVDGRPTENPRYLQTRPDLENPRAEYLAMTGARFYRRLAHDQPVHFPVNAVLPGRRNNPPDAERGIRALAVYGPIHYQDPPELMMDFIASLTGKSPSTTGAGTEGALTKGPFNALQPVHDLNTAIISFALTGYPCFSSAAGFIGRKWKVDHDISLLIPEIWSRMFIREREPAFLIEHGLLEPCEDFEHNGVHVPASRLGWRITENFVQRFFGRVFSDPAAVFTTDMLRPELQGMDDYADGIDNIVSTQRRVALGYFEDGSMDLAIPPLKALLHLMAHDGYEGMTLHHPELRAMFTRESITGSDWYPARLEAKLRIEQRRCREQIRHLEQFLTRSTHQREAKRLGIEQRLEQARRHLASLEQGDAIAAFNGTIGAEPSLVPSAE